MDLTTFGMAGVAAITVICYLAATAVKQTPLANKWLPTICGTLEYGPAAFEKADR